VIHLLQTLPQRLYRWQECVGLRAGRRVFARESERAQASSTARVVSRCNSRRHQGIRFHLWAAVLLGFLFNAAPGAVFAETVKVGVRGGFKPALAVQIGSLLGDAVWAILGLLGIGVLLQVDILRLPIGVAGVAYLLWLSYDSWKAANSELGKLSNSDEAVTRDALKSGALLSLTNPQNIAFWAALGSALGSLGISDPEPMHYAVFFAGFMASSVAWSFVCSAMVDRLFRNAGQKWATLTYKRCALAFLLLAISSAKQLINSRQPELSKAMSIELPTD